MFLPSKAQHVRSFVNPARLRSKRRVSNLQGVILPHDMLKQFTDCVDVVTISTRDLQSVFDTYPTSLLTETGLNLNLKCPHSCVITCLYRTIHGVRNGGIPRAHTLKIMYRLCRCPNNFNEKIAAWFCGVFDTSRSTNLSTEMELGTEFGVSALVRYCMPLARDIQCQKWRDMYVNNMDKDKNKKGTKPRTTSLRTHIQKYQLTWCL